MGLLHRPHARLVRAASTAATLLVLGALHARPLEAFGDGSVRFRVGDVKVVEAKAGRVTLDVGFDVTLAKGAVRPTSIMVIAVLRTASGKELKANATVPVPAAGPLPTTARVVVNHEEQIKAASELKASISVGILKEGATAPSTPARKELTLRIP